MAGPSMLIIDLVQKKQQTETSSAETPHLWPGKSISHWVRAEHVVESCPPNLRSMECNLLRKGQERPLTRS